MRVIFFMRRIVGARVPARHGRRPAGLRRSDDNEAA
jgi:hypothetical protein